MAIDPNRVKEVFLEATGQADEAARAAFLDRACNGDAELRDRVEALLRSHDNADSFLGTPAVQPPEPNGATQELGDVASQTPKDQTVSLNGEGDDAMADNKKTAPSAGGDDDLQFLSPSTRPDSLGRLGHYEMLQVLGKGGFGIVFRAFDDILQRVVAVKVMAPQIATLSPARKRFLREAQSSAKVRHEHVVQIYEVGEQPLPFLAMEFIPGETLQQKLDRCGPLEVTEILQIGRQIAEGLAAAHACDLIHRDIKPSNILLEGGSHKAKITDFGLARAADDASISQSGIIAGTPMFMAPEQALGHKIDQRADLFSLGSVLYQMASGRPPFRAPTALAVLKRVAEESPRPIPEIIPETPDWLCGIIAKLHAKDPDERFQSAREVADLLAGCEAKLKAKQEVKNIIPAPAVKPAAPTGRKWQWAAAALALVLLLGGVWFGRAAMLYLSDRGELELVPQEGLMSVIVLQNDEGVIDGNKLHAPVTDWLDMKKSHTLKLPPGRYQLNAGTWPAGTHMSQWEVATSGPFGSNRVTVPVINTSAIVTVERGHRVTLRAVMRSEPPGAKQEPPPLVADWVPLFNGTDLAGWKTNENDKWKVENGVLIGSARGHLFANQTYQDFHCRIKARYNADTSGSLAFRGVAEDNGEALAHGEIRIGNRLPGKTGSAHLWHKPKPERVANWDRELVPPDTWFELELIVRGKTVVAKVNGTTTADITLDRLPERGRISLNAYRAGTVLEFKKIEIKELPADPSQSPPLAVAPFDAAKAKELQELWAKHLGAPVEVTNSLGMRLRLIPPGEFTMGSDPAEVDRLLTRTAEFKDAPAWVQDQVRSEGPDRRVTMREPFYLGAHEVTVGQFREFVNATGYRTDAEKTGGFVWNNDIKNWERRPEYVWRNSTYAASETHPVVFLTLTDARTFCAWLGEKEGRRYAIPTEEQWEYACRAGTTARWFFGDDEARMKEFGWTMPHSNGPNQPVGRLGANPFGLFDVYGNAIELTVTPQGRTVERGGDAGVADLRSRSASRHVVAKQDETTFRRGFRVAVVGDLSLARVPSGVPSPEAKTPLVPAAKQEPLPPTYKNSIGMEFVIVPKGKSWLGGGKDKLGEKEVEIRADFYLGKYEVTQEEWEKVMGENPSWFSRAGGGKNAVKDITDADLKRFPVEKVSWDQCQIFLAKLNKLAKETGWVYRLPTEVEWEYACRGGPMSDKRDSAFDFYLVKPTNTLLPDQANIKHDNGLNRTCKVGSYAPNMLGLYDMHGNVSEWCDDSVKAPSGATRFLVRSDGWDYSGFESKRGATVLPQFRTWSLGLRLARVPAGATAPETTSQPLAADVLNDAVLLMSFEKDTFYQKDGKTYVRDMSGNGNDGLCEDVEFTPDGKAGGGLACKGGRLRLNKSLIIRQPNYTITLWGRADKIGANMPKERLYSTARAEDREELVFRLALPPERSVHINAFNRAKQPDKWVGSNSKLNVIPESEWYFLAVTLSGGDVKKGELRVTVNETVIPLTSQMVDSSLDGLVDMLGHQMIDCVLDEVAIFHRALTGQEIAAVRALGLKGTPLSVGKASPATAPFTDANVQRIAALPAAEQVEEVRKELMRRNPGFDGKMEHKIKDGVVTELRIVTDKVTDIAPIRVWTALRVLECRGTWTKPNGLLADLTPLEGMNLAALWHLNLRNTKVTDAGMVCFKDCKNLTVLELSGTAVSDVGLIYFKDCKNLTYLNLGRTQVSDAGLIHFKDCTKLTGLHLWDMPKVGDAGLIHFKDCKNLTNLNFAQTRLSDTGLANFKGMRLTHLYIDNTGVTDLNPLQGMPLEEIYLTPKNITRGLDILRDMKSLKTIGIAHNQSWPAAEFWERYGKGEFKE